MIQDKATFLLILVGSTVKGPRVLDRLRYFSTRGNLHFTDKLAMAAEAEPRPEMLDNKSQLNLILIPLNLNLTPTLTLTGNPSP